MTGYHILTQRPPGELTNFLVNIECANAHECVAAVARKVASEEVGPGLMGRAEKAVVTIKLVGKDGALDDFCRVH